MDDFKRKLIIGFILFIFGICIFIAGFFLKGFVEALVIIIGAILAIFGMRTFVNANIAKRKFLKTAGIKVQAKIKYISVAVTASLNRQMAGDLVSFKVICEGQGIITNKAIEYISPDIWLQPDIQINNNFLVDVYVNPKDENDYWVDTDKIPVKNYTHFDRPWNVTTVYYRSYDGINYQKV